MKPTIALCPAKRTGVPGTVAELVAVVDVPNMGLPSNPGNLRTTIYDLDDLSDVHALAARLSDRRPTVVYEDAKRDRRALRRAGVNAPESFECLSLMVHAVTAERSWCDEGEWQNGVYALAKARFRGCLQRYRELTHLCL
jgi:hypothetical protein